MVADGAPGRGAPWVCGKVDRSGSGFPRLAGLPAAGAAPGLVSCCRGARPRSTALPVSLTGTCNEVCPGGLL